MKKLIPVLIFLIIIILPNTAFATLGVGVGTGKIQVRDKLKPGTIYELPSLTVLNTGDEASDYEVSVSYHEKQPQLKPLQSWFIFSPQKFHLKPGKSQTVKIKLDLPVRSEPGNYFAYLEGHPTKKAVSGNTSIGVAAAAKLYFTVVPGSFFEAVYYKITSFWTVYSPWPQRILIALLIFIAYLFVRKNFNIQIGVKGKDSIDFGSTPKSRLKRVEEIRKQKNNE